MEKDIEQLIKWGHDVRYRFICDRYPCISHEPTSKEDQWSHMNEQFADSYKSYTLDRLGFEDQGFSEDNAGDARHRAFEQQLDWVFGKKSSFYGRRPWR